MDQLKFIKHTSSKHCSFVNNSLTSAQWADILFFGQGYCVVGPPWSWSVTCHARILL